VITDPGMDAVLIGTWPNRHRGVTVAALEAGKHVLCEARMAMGAAEARSMFAVSLAHNGVVAQIVPARFTFELDGVVKLINEVIAHRSSSDNDEGRAPTPDSTSA